MENAVSFDQFRDAVVDRLKVDPGKVQPESFWVQDVGITSVDIVKIVMLIRQKFGVKVPTSTAGKIKTVEEAYRLVAQGA